MEILYSSVAIGHKILVIAWNVLAKKESYKEKGGGYFDRRSTEGQKRRLIRRLESLSLRVTVEEIGEAA